MNKLSKIKIIILSLLFFTFKEYAESEEVSFSEQELIILSNEDICAYVPDNVRELVIALSEGSIYDDSLHNCLNDLKQKLCVARYDSIRALISHSLLMLENIRPLVDDNKYTETKVLLSEYNSALDNGEALITVETKGRKNKCLCSLFVKRLVAGNLRVVGNTTFEGDVIINNGQLIGPTGPIGAQGPTGPAGAPGPTGATGPGGLSNCPDLRMTFGTFSTPSTGDPVILSCSGDCVTLPTGCDWDVVRTGMGPNATWAVTFDTPFLSLPAVTASVAKSTGGGMVTVDVISTTGISFDTNADPDSVSFIAISCCG